MWFNPGIYDLPLPTANYQLFQPKDLPVYQDENIWAKVIIGDAFHLTSPVITRWPIQYLHIKLAPGKTYQLNIPDTTWQGFIYIISGQGQFGANKSVGTTQQCLVLGSEATSAIEIHNTHSTPLECIFGIGAPHHKPFVKLLAHGGAIVADTEAHARAWMQEYEQDPEHFGGV